MEGKKASTCIGLLSQNRFEEIVRLIPSIQQDAYRVAYYLGLALADVVRIRGKDVTEGGINSRGRLFAWYRGHSNSDSLEKRVLTVGRECGPEERLFESHKPTIKAAWDLENGFKKGIENFELFCGLQRKFISARLPNFLVLGAPKCATTWLYQCLGVHPEVYVPLEKELEFFGNYRYHLGLNWYKQHFLGWGQQKVGGDVSVGYFSSEEAPAQIAELLGSNRVKLIVSLREPVNRALSYYEYRFLSGNAPSSFEKSLKMRYFRKLYVETGHYYRYYERYLNYFSKDQILIILFEEIQRDPIAVLRRVFEFLGVQPDFVNEVFRKKSNLGMAIKNRNLHFMLYKIGLLFQVAFPHRGVGGSIRTLTSRLNSKINVTPRRMPQRIDERGYKDLRNEFRTSNKKLAILAGLDLSLWE